ncbi:MAG: phage holin family protein [Oscillospiraceae bacterium]|jgi:hypothetical protein|nr:phage holin family protein [Oscillospiraceae bacterium]
MNSEIMDIIIKAVISIAVAVITGFIIPWLANIAAKHKDSLVTQLIVRFVRASEQTFGAGKGDQKLEYVLNRLKEAGISISPAVRAAIEEAVYSLTQATTDNISKI